MAFQDLSVRDADEFVIHAVNISDSLANLTYLICVEADHPAQVRLYAQEVEERLRALGDLLKSAACDKPVTLYH